MAKIAVISCILENPKENQQDFNDIVADFRGSIRGRMGLPFEEGISIISLTVIGDKDDIDELSHKLEKVNGVTVNTTIAKKEI